MTENIYNYAMQINWLNMLFKSKLINLEEYMKIKKAIDQKFKIHE